MIASRLKVFVFNTEISSNRLGNPIKMDDRAETCMHVP